MAELTTFEGTREELLETLDSYPKDQRFRLTPLPVTEGSKENAAMEPSLEELFRGRVGRFHFGDANLSKDSGKKFAAIIAEKRKQGRL